MSELTVWASTCLESSTPALNVQMAPRLETMKFLWLCLWKPPFSSIILSHNAHILSKFKCMLWNQRFWIFLLLPLESTFSLFSIYMTLIIWIANSSPHWFSTYNNILTVLLFAVFCWQILPWEFEKWSRKLCGSQCHTLWPQFDQQQLFHFDPSPSCFNCTIVLKYHLTAVRV